jgi:hypothetical protein
MTAYVPVDGTQRALLPGSQPAGPDNAGPGWNACAGLGTPDGTAILNKALILLQIVETILRVTFHAGGTAVRNASVSIDDLLA